MQCNCHATAHQTISAIKATITHVHIKRDAAPILIKLGPTATPVMVEVL
jgi:hypothetical protein